MTEKEQKILDTFAILIPKMTLLQKEKLLSFGEGIALKTELEEQSQQEVIMQ